MARNYFIFAIVSSGLMMVSIDATIVSVALPSMLRDFDVSLALVSWTLTSYQLTQTIVLPLAGTLADRFGRKRVFLCAVILFSAGSAGCGVAPSIYVLIAFRVIQAIGGGMFFPSAAGVVGDVFPEGPRQTAVGLFVTIFQIGGVIGPNIGGVITDHLSWRWIFFVNLPIGLAILLLGLPFLPKDRPRNTASAHRLDTTGVSLFAGGMCSLLFGLTYLANHPGSNGSPEPWAFLGGGLLLLILFVRNEGRVAEPIIDLKLMRWRPFLACNAQLFMWSSAFNGFFNFIPYYATIAYGMSATQSGAILTPRSLTAVVVSAISSVFIGRLGYRLPWLAGIYLLGASMLLMSLGLRGVSFLGLGVSDFFLLSTITCVAGLGIGIAIPPSQNAAFDLLPDQMASSAGFRAMFGNTGAVIGITSVTLVLSHFTNKAVGMQYIFFALGCIVLLSQVWVFFVPDTAKQRGRLRRAEEVTPAAALE